MNDLALECAKVTFVVVFWAVLLVGLLRSAPAPSAVERKRSRHARIGQRMLSRDFFAEDD